MDYYKTKSYPLSGVPAPLWDAYTDIQPAEQTLDDHIIQSIARHIDDELDREEMSAEAREWVATILDHDTETAPDQRRT